MDIPELLPDTHPMLARVMPKFEFKGREEQAKEIANLLVEAMAHYGGIGLAANQIGLEENACVVTLDVEDESKKRTIVMFNPMLTWLSVDSVKMDEGCLTFEGLFLAVSRPKEVQVTYHDVNGTRQALDLKGWDARVVLHETDHLNGIVFTSLVSKLRLEMAKKKAAKTKKSA